MSYKILGIHGLSNKPPKDKHSRDWIEAIKEGLQRNCSLSLQQIDFDLVYWADINYPQPIETEDEPYEHRFKDQPIKNYRDNWLSELRANVLDVAGDAIEQARRWFGLDSISNKILERKLTDLDQYYRNGNSKRTLRDLVKKAILDHQDKRITLIAHSMGSIISYDALRELGRENANHRIDNFITIGSPLGLPTVAAQIDEEWKRLRTPSIVKRWINFADPRDPVAVDTHLKDDYDSNDTGVLVEDDLILNNYIRPDGKPNFHKIYGYLRCPEMSELLRGII